MTCRTIPVITGLSTSGGTTTITRTFNSTASTTFALDFYALSLANASGFGEGRYVLGTKPVTTDGSGNANFTVSFPTPAEGVAVRFRDGDRPQWQHVGILARLWHRHAAHGSDRLYAA